MFQGQDRCPGFEDTETCREQPVVNSAVCREFDFSHPGMPPRFVPYHKAYQVAWAGSGTQAAVILQTSVPHFTH